MFGYNIICREKSDLWKLFQIILRCCRCSQNNIKFLRRRPCIEQEITDALSLMKGLPMNPIPLKIAYIGGGSRDWARKLMIDVALCPDLTGEIVLYDIERFSIDSSQLKGEFVIRLWDIVRNG